MRAAMNSTSEGWSGVGGRHGPEDREVEGRAVIAGRVREAVAVGELAPVALVADGPALAAEHVAVVESGPVEQPVVGPVDRVAAGAAGGSLADAVVAASGEADAGHLVLGPADLVVGPHGGELADAIGAVHGVGLEEALVPDHRRGR